MRPGRDGAPALGIAGGFCVVLGRVSGAPAMSAGLAVVSLILFFGLWFGLALAIPARRGQPARSEFRISSAVR